MIGCSHIITFPNVCIVQFLSNSVLGKFVYCTLFQTWSKVVVIVQRFRECILFSTAIQYSTCVFLKRYILWIYIDIFFIIVVVYLLLIHWKSKCSTVKTDAWQIDEFLLLSSIPFLQVIYNLRTNQIAIAITYK